METVNTKQLLETLENRVEGHLEVAVRHFQNLSEQALLQPAANGGWSIAQCLEHLNSYGDYYLPQMEKGMNKFGNQTAKDTFKSSWLGHYFIQMMEPTTGKKKYKAFKGHIPVADLEAYAVVATFIQQQEQLLTLLKKARQTDLNKVLIPISISRFIRLKLGDVFSFIIAHDERHIQQALRVHAGY
ncbi:MAG: DinB family protein [Spirosomataceae bacterium]